MSKFVWLHLDYVTNIAVRVTAEMVQERTGRDPAEFTDHDAIHTYCGRFEHYPANTWYHGRPLSDLRSWAKWP